MHFPNWSLQRIVHHRPDLRDRPFALTRPIANKGSKVVACSAKAHRLGVRPGMVTAEALAILPALVCASEDPEADRQTLLALAEWAQRFSPIVGLEDSPAPECLLIDMTGGAACFGGDDALLDKARDDFHALGWSVTLALADTLAAAWARAVFDLNLATPIADFPIAALRLSSGNVGLLRQLGIDRLGPLLELPRDEVAERFGPEVSRRVDQLTGRAGEVITPVHPLPEASARWTFDDPIDRHDLLVRALDLLLDRLQALLEQRRVGARLIECVLEAEGAAAQRFECSLARPARTASYLRPLVHLKLEQVRVDAPVRALSLRALVLERCPDEQPNLFEAGHETALAQLLDGLTSRLGKEAVTMARPLADPQPELACRFEPAACRTALTPGPGSVGGRRPLRLFPRPIPLHVASEPGRALERFQHAGTDYFVVGSQGPERIDTGWWRGPEVHRDYYLVETADGARWWLFQRRDDGGWFLHGCFD